MEYLFVYNPESQGWWLKVDTIEKLLDYWEQTKDSRLSGAIDLYWSLCFSIAEIQKNRKKKRNSSLHLRGGRFLADKG